MAPRFLDLDHDGVKEIIASARYGQGRFALMVFDSRGRELSRQSECGGIDLLALDAENGVCPMTGEDATFDEQANGTMDIVVADWNGERRFSLVKGRLVRR